MDPPDPKNGDCHKDICLNGMVVTVVDDNDAPPKIDPTCLRDACMGGMIVKKPVLNGLPCMAGMMMMGQCCKGSCHTQGANDSCADGCHDFVETDIDCGGPVCTQCTTGKACLANDDCKSLVCMAGVCL